jgi:DNA-binding response OmpR family regulator
MRILLAEDDPLLADALFKSLERHNFLVDVVGDGETALAQVKVQTYALLILDVMMPYKTGIQVCKQLRLEGNDIPILFLTARDSSQHKVEGLDAGADDYVVKPVDVPELLARMRALLRRSHFPCSTTFTWGDLTLNSSTHEVTYREHPIHLTPREFSLLELFLRSGRRVLSCQNIIDQLWSYEETPEEDAVRTHIKTLRQKLKKAEVPTDLIETVFGVGYRLKHMD